MINKLKFYMSWIKLTGNSCDFRNDFQIKLNVRSRLSSSPSSINLKVKFELKIKMI